MNTRSPRNDDDALAAVRGSLTAVRDSLEGVHMERPVEALVTRGRARRARRSLAIRAAVACGTAAATVAAVIAVTGGASGAPAPTGASAAQARTIAYVTSRVEQALANENQVFVGRGVSKVWGPTVTWSYGSQSRFEEFTGSECGHALANGECTHRGGSELYLADGTALVGGKLTSAYVTYFDRKFSLEGAPWSPARSACSPKAALEISGPPSATIHWSAFINATLACGAASVTGHVRIGDRETTKITGKPVTLRLPAGEARAVGEKWVTARWALYVDPTTYLPVRMYGSNETFGGRWPRSTSSGVTDVQWLPPTAANVAKTLVIIPPGFRQVASAADQ